MPDLPTPTTDIPHLPPRDPTTHKGQVGRIAIIAGSKGMSGAAVLCGLGALRGGAGLVRVFTPESVYPLVAGGEPCYMTTPLHETIHGDIAYAPCVSAVEEFAPAATAIGPGLGPRWPSIEKLVRRLSPDRPLVLDADALNAVAAHEQFMRDKGADPDSYPQPLYYRKAASIITPHPGEMARLRQSARMPELKGDEYETRLRIAHEYAVYSGATVVLKGHRTVVCTPDRAFSNTTGNPGMAAGGMGDVLTGLIAALLGQGLDAFDAARLGVFVHGLAGDRAAESIGSVGYLAREVADLIPAALALASNRPIGFHNQDD